MNSKQLNHLTHVIWLFNLGLFGTLAVLLFMTSSDFDQTEVITLFTFGGLQFLGAYLEIEFIKMVLEDKP